MTKQLNIFSFIDDAALSTLCEKERLSMFSVLLAFNNGEDIEPMLEDKSVTFILIVHMAINSYNVIFGDDSEKYTSNNINNIITSIKIAQNNVEVEEAEINENSENSESLACASEENNNINNLDNNINNNLDNTQGKEEIRIENIRDILYEKKKKENQAKEISADTGDNWQDSREYFNKVKILWNATCKSLPSVVKYGANIGRGVAARTKEMEWPTMDVALEELGKIFARIQESDWLTGRIGNWCATFDWIMCHPNNFTNIVNGGYRNNAKANGNDRKSHAGSQNSNFGTYIPNGEINVNRVSEETVGSVDGFDFGGFEEEGTQA